MTQVDRKHLKGITFRGAISKEVEVNGKKRLKWTAFERDMTPDDVLSFVDKGSNVVIVGKDGRKHIVNKSEAKAEAKQEVK
jgi:hypothetical protein